MVPASVHTATTLTCVAPPQAQWSDTGSYVPVTVAKSSDDFGLLSSRTNRGPAFEFVEPPEVLRLEPTMGPSAGGTRVHVTVDVLPPPASGGGADGVWCRFDEIVVPGTVDVEAAVIVCVTPPLSVGQHPVEISTNGQEFSDSEVLYRSRALSTIETLRPPFGSVLGGTEVIVTGQNFSHADHTLTCAFDDVRVPATVLSSQELVCTTPPFSGDAWVDRQQITITSRTPQQEIQVVSLEAAPDGPEVQVLTTKGWGVAPEIQELALSYPDAGLERIEVTTTAGYQPEIQELLLMHVPQLPEVQAVTTSAQSVLSGSFQLLVLGFPTASIAFDASAAVVAQALTDATLGSHSFSVQRLVQSASLQSYTWLVTFTSDVGAVNLMTLKSASLLGGTLANVAITRVRGGSVAEVQTIAVYGPALGATTTAQLVIVVDTGDGHTRRTPPVDIHADAPTMRTALGTLADVLKDVSVVKRTSTVAGDDLYEWDVRFDVQAPPVPRLRIEILGSGVAGAYVRQTTAGTSPPPSGVFSLTVGAETTPPLAWDAPITTIKAALEGLATVDVVLIQEQLTTSALRDLRLTFPPQNGNLPLLVANTAAATLSGSLGDRQSTLSAGLRVGVTAIDDAAPLGGTFQITSLTTGQLVPMAVTADCPTVQVALGGVSCVVTGPGLSGERRWRVEYASTYVLPYTVAVSSTGMTGASPGVSVRHVPLGNKDEIQQITTSLSPVPEIQRLYVTERGMLWEIQSVTVLADTTKSVQGFFQLVFGSRRSSPLAKDASAADLEAALRGIYAPAGDIAVSRISATQGATLAGYRWDVTFYTAVDVAPLSVASNFTVGATQTNVVELRKGPTAEIQNVTMLGGGGALTGVTGTFVVSFGGQVTPPLPFDASADAFAAALGALSTMDAVNVTRVRPNTEQGTTWMVTFPFQAGDLPSLRVTSVVVTTGSPAPSFRVTEVVQGRIRPVSGSFAISYLGQSTTVALSSTATQLQSALSGLSTLSALSVQVGAPSSDLVGGRSWDITFGTGMPTTALLGVDTSSTVGDAPYAVVRRLQLATPPEVQRIETKSPAGGTLSGSFFLAYGDDETPALTATSTAAQIEAALNALPSIGSVTVTRTSGSSGGSSFVWSVTFTAPKVHANPLLLFAGGAQTTLVSTANDAQIDVTELVPGTLSPIAGNWSVTVNNARATVAANASQAEVAAVLQELTGATQVLVTRTVVGNAAAYGAFSWLITFRGLGDVPTLTVDRSRLTSTGSIGLTVSVVQDGVLGCCVGDTFRLGYGALNEAIPGLLSVEQNWRLVTTSVDLTSVLVRGERIQINGWVARVDPMLPFTPTSLPLDTAYPGPSASGLIGFRQRSTAVMSPATVSTATLTEQLRDLPGAARIVVTESYRHNNGDAKWRITFPTPNLWGLVEALAIPSGALPRLTATTTQLQGRQDPEVRLLYVAGSAPIHGSFRMSLDGTTFQSVPWNATAEEMTAALQSPGFFETVVVERKRLHETTAHPMGDGYGWLVTFISEAGATRAIQFDTTTIQSEYRNDVLAGSILVSPSQSTKLAGSFQLGYRGTWTPAINYDATASDLQTALATIYDVNSFRVSRSATPDPNGGRSWSVTFEPSYADHLPGPPFRLLEVNAAGVTGTRATVEIVRQAPGSTLAGTFRLGLDGLFTGDLPVNSPTEVVQQALVGMSSVGNVNVRRVAGSTAAWRIEYVDLIGRLEPLAIDTTKVTGTNVAAIVSREQEGIAPLAGEVVLGFDGKTTEPLAVTATPEEIIRALEKSTRARVTSVQVQTVVGSPFSRLTWDLTFLAPFQPTDICRTPLIQVDRARVTGSDVKSVVTKISSPCVKVRVYENEADAISGTLAFGYVDIPVVDAVVPALGPSTGGTSVVIRGRAFVPGPELSCLFEDVEVPAEFLNTTAIRCVSPPVDLGESSMRASFVAVKTAIGDAPREFVVSSTRALFQHHRQILLADLVPTHGPVQGGTTVTIRGRHFLNRPTLQCRFVLTWEHTPDVRAVIVNATFLTSERISCRSPPTQGLMMFSGGTWAQEAHGTAALAVTNNAVDFVEAPLPFVYRPMVAVQSVIPSLGPLSGGTSVRVTTTSAIDANHNVTHCRFGDGRLPMVPAIRESPNAVTCKAPRHAAQPTVVSITANASALLGEIQVVSAHGAPGTSIAGYFVLGLSDSATRPIASDASAMGASGSSSMLEALGDLPVAGIQAIARTGPDAQGGYTWTITFDPSCGDVAELVADSSLLQNDDAFVSVQTVREGPTVHVVRETQRVLITQTGLMNPAISLKLPLLSVVQEVQRVTVTSTQSLSGTFTISYVGFPSAALDWDATEGEMTEALSAVPGVGIIVVTRARAAKLHGYTWDVTFRTQVAGRPLLALATTSFTSSGVITKTITRQSTGSAPLGGTFALGLVGGTIVNALAFDLTADDLRGVLTEKLLLGPIDVTKTVAATEIVWAATFAMFDVRASKLYVPSSSLTGTTGLQVVDDTARGASLSGAFALTVAGKRTNNIPIASGASIIQQELLNLAIPETVGVTVSRRVVALGFELDLVFGLVAGDVAAVTVDKSGIVGPGVTVGVTTVQDGNYAPLGGTFVLATGGTTKTASLGYQATAALVQTELEKLVAVPISSIVRDVLAGGFRWLITFDGVVDASTLGNVVGQSSLVGTGAGLIVEIIDPGMPLSVPVSVSTNGQDFAPTTTLFQYLLPIEVVSMTPTTGPVGGNTPIQFGFASALVAPKVYCRFDDQIVQAALSMDGLTATCRSTSQPSPRLVQVDLSMNGYDFDVLGGWYQFHADESSLFELSPSHGVVDGGTLVAISGTTFAAQRPHWCRFGNQVVSAEGVNATHLLCRTPPTNAGPGPVGVSVSVNGINFTSFERAFTYEPTPFVTRIFPFAGDLNGGERVAIYGGNFDSGSGQLQCRFGDTVVDATIVSAQEAHCVSPELHFVPEVQELSLSVSPLVPEIQSVLISADPLVPTVQEVQLLVDPKKPEIQEFRVYGDPISEIQRVSVKSQGFSGELMTIQSTITPIRSEVQVIRFDASTYIGGSFLIRFEDHQTTTLTSYATLQEVKQALEQLSNIGHVSVSKTVLGSLGSCFWEITFVDRVGDLPLIEVVNLTLSDSGSRDLRVSVFELVQGQGAPLHGSFQLSIDGTLTQSLVYDSTTDEVRQAIETVTQSPASVTRQGPDLNKGYTWSISFTGFPDRTRTILPVVTQLAGGRGQITVTMPTPGSKSEQQTIATSLSSGSFTCSILTRSSSSIPFDADAAAVGAAFDVDDFGRIDVSGVPGGPWTLTFVDWANDVPLLDCGPQQTVTEAIKGNGAMLGGTFRLGVGGVWTAPLAVGASAGAVEAALEALHVLVNVSVTSDGVDYNGGGSWEVTFSNLDGNLTLLQVDDATLSGEMPHVVVSEVQAGNAVEGHVRLEAGVGVVSLPFSVDASVAEITAALNAMGTTYPITAIAVSRLVPARGLILKVTFDSAIGDIESLRVTAERDLQATGLQLRSSTLQNATEHVNGTFRLGYGGFRTPEMAWNVSAEELEMTLKYLKSIPDGDLRVTRLGPDADDAVSWQVTFPYGLKSPSTPLVPEFSLVGPNARMNVVVQGTETIRLAGNVTLGLRGETTSDLSVRADSATIVQALQALSSVDTVGVDVVEIASNQIRWDVTFLGLRDTIAPAAMLSAPQSSLTGTNSGVSVTPRQSRTHNAIQSLSVSFPVSQQTASFKLVWNSQSSTITASTVSSASAFKAAVESIPNVGTVTVERYPSTVGIGFTWIVLFVDQPGAVSPLSIAFVAAAPTGVVIDIQTTSPSTTVALAGAFTLSHGETCQELTIGGWCPPTKSSLLPVNAGAALVEHELSLFPLLEDIAVTQTTAIAGMRSTWQVTFPAAFGTPALLQLDAGAVTGSAVVASVGRLIKGVGLNGGQVAVEVSSNGQDYSSSGVVFQYVPMPSVTTVYPTHGPQTGGTEVLVMGINFHNSSTLRCRFGSRVVLAAAFLNSTHITCVSPSRRTPGDTYLEVSSHSIGENTSFTDSRQLFTYDPPIEIDDVFPALGPTLGNFSVTLTGRTFGEMDEIRCKFGEIVVVAERIANDEIRCMAPPHRVGIFPLAVSRNDQDYTDTRVPFYYYPEQGIHRIYPVFGPARAAATLVTVEGQGFVNSSLLSCRFGYVVTPGEYVTPTQMRCRTPAVSKYSGDLAAAPISEYRNTNPDPTHGSVYLFPTAHYFPQYLTRLVAVEVSNNQQDFTLSGVNFMYYHDVEVQGVHPKKAYDVPSLSLFVQGRYFMNTTSLQCRVGVDVFPATFISSQLLLCLVDNVGPYQTASHKATRTLQASHAFVEVSNNAVDFTTSHTVFEFLGPCPTGSYCPRDLQGQRVQCPRGTYCPGEGNRNFTLCPRGTYQPKLAQAACLRCPIGYHCPHEGMHVPRVCPAGFVCETTGIEEVYQPCPEGHFCLEGTATASVTCAPQMATGAIVGSAVEAEFALTTRRRRERPPTISIGARRSGCWNNETSDFGLQVSRRPSRFWSEIKQLPLAPEAIFAPLRGRFCLDDACLRLADSDGMLVQDEDFDYASTAFALRRPIVCPAGTYCHPGTAGNAATMKNYTQPQPCFESMYCPEGSASPMGFGECASGFYCPYGIRLPCPAGTYCPKTGHTSPLPCPPGTFNGMVAQSKCTACPVSYICPGFNRLLPVLCPAGYVCSKEGLASPNSLCPPGFYCLEGTGTVDPFRNDTRLRPYPCKPGTYCLKGVVADEVRTGDYRYPQNCTEGFYCELGSSSPKGSGLCPPGFTCPAGTAAPIPTDPGKFAELNGTVSAADCAPGYYAPTIESTECIPCPPGTSCENDGTAVADVCPPGSYRGGLTVDGVSCLACPQGTWSKNWELRGVEECMECAPGTVCPIDGITYPCTSDDLPHLYVPVAENLSFSECLEKGEMFFFGVLLEPWIDELGRGPHFVPARDGRCYENHQPLGSVLYQRLADFHGPLFELTNGGIPHQGYGDVNQWPVPTMFERGALVIDLPVSQMYDVARNCTKGFFHYGQWFPGTCEADIICHSASSSAISESLVAQAQPCPEGYVCDQYTSAIGAFAHPCPGGYVCGPGTTPDLNLEAPQGQLKELCPASKYCVEGTAESQKERSLCPAGYFCPTGTTNPYIGAVADDGMRRRLTAQQANPFYDLNYTKYIGEGDIRVVSAHDMRCFNGIDDDLEKIFNLRQRTDGSVVVVNRAIENDLLCARDHKWRLVDLAIRRNECDCVAQARTVHQVYRLWKCTVPPSTPDPTVYNPNLYGWKPAHNSKKECLFADENGDIIDILAEVQRGGVSFRTSWTEFEEFTTYLDLKTAISAKYRAHINEIPSFRLDVDPYLYDLNHAVQVIEDFGEETTSMIGFVAGSNSELIRLDTCGCPKLLKCPNGTTSGIGADDIYDCVKTSSEILQRVTPIPLDHPRLKNGTDYSDLSGTGAGIGTVVLEPLEVAVVTINTTLISRNMTYKDHYQISVYPDCKPCPPRYKCNLKSIPPSCSYPDNDNTTATNLFDKCMNDKGDPDLCNAMPFFCDRHFVERTNEDGSTTVANSYPGCCSCERQEMPYYFEDTTSDLGYPDNKHGYLQFSITAVVHVELTIVVELLHGLYVRDFVEGFTEDRFDLQIFTPSRADYSPLTPSTNTFFAVMQKSTYDSLMLPLNLPETRQRLLGTLTYERSVENRIFIDRISDIMVGDAQLPKKRGFVRNSQQNSIGQLTQKKSIVNGSDLLDVDNATDPNIVVRGPDDYFGLYQVVDPLNTVLRSDVWWAQQLGGTEFIALPYFPFFSSCRGYDSHIPIAKLLEAHPDCSYVSYEETVEVNQYPWKKKLTPNADSCTIEFAVSVPAGSGKQVIETHHRGISLSCKYEENLEGGAEKPRWYESKSGTTLFYLTRDPASPNDFVEQDARPWGRTKTFEGYLNTDKLIAVKVGENAGLELAVPQEVYLNLSYYQMEQGKKRLVEAELNFGRLCTVSRSTDIIAKMAKKGISTCAINRATQQIASSEYVFQVTWKPLTWFELMNLFQFTVDVYLGFFMLVGLLSIIQSMIIWVINRLFTKMKKPPKFRMKILLKNIATPSSTGTFLAAVPISLTCAFIYLWWYGFNSSAPVTDPSVVSFEGVAGDWLDQISLNNERITKYNKGRVGVSLVVTGAYMVILGSRLLIPETMDPQYEDNAYKEMAAAPKDPFDVEEDKEEAEENEFWDPRAWKQANLLLTTVSFISFLLVIWEFSYSPIFTANTYGFLVAFKVLRNLVEIVIETVLHEKLLVMPFVVVLSATESMIAMGAADFIGFTLFYFVNLSFVIMERLYFAPLLRHLWGMWPKWRMMIHRKFQKKRRRTREQKAQEEAEWRRICEKIDNQVAGVESVLEGVAGYAIVFTELFVAPLVLLFQVVFSADTMMPDLYGVKHTDLLYYALFSLFIIPSNLVMGVFQLNTMELVHGWKIYEYISYQKHRFATRDLRWQMLNPARDESVHPAFQTIDMLCFSSQFYFLVTLFAFGILFMMFGATVFLRYGYSLFGDIITLVIIIVMCSFSRVLELACIRVGDRLGIWKQTKLDGTLDDEIAAKLALGAGRQKDLERERLELQALNSERFRHRFMERNRPWVLQHLVELFTPRTLNAVGADGRPNSEYVRDIYHELMNMGEGRRLHGDRSDISSDSEDELEKMRRSWSNVPVDGASKDIVLFWLARARKRRTFSKLVAGIIANNKQSSCAVCQKSEEGGYSMHVDLANTDGSGQDPTAIDRLIYGFEEEFGELELDSDLWKAYFRKHATYITLCNVCLSALEQKRLARVIKQPVAQRVLREDEFSSDDEADVQFDPIVVARLSIEGRVLSKWLLAARKRLGGIFPREHARQEMEAYAKKMRMKKARKGKVDHVDSDEEDPSLHWKLQLNEASRAIALRWVWQARDTRYAVFREHAKQLRQTLEGMCDKIQEVDDWFYGKDLRMDGVNLAEEARDLDIEQSKHDEEMRQKINQTERDIEAFEKEKRDATAIEVQAFQNIIDKEGTEARERIEAREKELLELQRKKEVDFVEQQRQAREEGVLSPMMVNEHRAYLAKMETERVAEIEKLTRSHEEKEAQKKDAFERKLALAENAIQSRKALAQHRILSIRKEAMNVLRVREKNWQSRAAGWMDKAGRKISVKEQEDQEAQANEKKRRKRVLLAS